jgi:predicted NAD-dependent protein-ADP-ribosyltransferase YbiA (DUF1768 family)/O-acetyl-ADP-ribose deacetylase (regulator of RNase III)
MRFRDLYWFLSNMSPAKVPLSIGGEDYVFDNAEAAFQAQKNPSLAKMFVGLTGKEAKYQGRRIPITTPDWPNARLDAMRKAVESKFGNNPDLMERLLGTGTEYISEDNDWGDTFWGISGGQGQNNLGKILMGIRDAAAAGSADASDAASDGLGKLYNRVVEGNMLDTPDPYALQQVNTLGVMGAGLARQIRDDISPEDYARYQRLSRNYGSDQLLGKVLPTKSVSHPDRTYLNIFGQSEIGRDPDKVYTDYGALETAFRKIAEHYPEGTNVSMPYGMGAGLANGDWDTVEKLADDILGSKFNLTKWKYRK